MLFRIFLHILLISFVVCYFDNFPSKDDINENTSYAARNVSIPGTSIIFFGAFRIVHANQDPETDSEACRNEGGQLAIIDSLAKQKAALNVLINYTESLTFQCTMRIGLNRKGNRFTWLDGSPLVDPTFWAIGEPNLGLGFDCVFIQRPQHNNYYNDTLNHWIVAPCSSITRVPLCQQHGAFVPTETSPSTQQSSTESSSMEYSSTQQSSFTQQSSTHYVITRYTSTTTDESEIEESNSYSWVIFLIIALALISVLAILRVRRRRNTKLEPLLGKSFKSTATELKELEYSTVLDVSATEAR